MGGELYRPFGRLPEEEIGAAPAPEWLPQRMQVRDPGSLARRVPRGRRGAIPVLTEEEKKRRAQLSREERELERLLGRGRGEVRELERLFASLFLTRGTKQKEAEQAAYRQAVEAATRRAMEMRYEKQYQEALQRVLGERGQR